MRRYKGNSSRKRALFKRDKSRQEKRSEKRQRRSENREKRREDSGDSSAIILYYLLCSSLFLSYVTLSSAIGSYLFIFFVILTSFSSIIHSCLLLHFIASLLLFCILSLLSYICSLLPSLLHSLSCRF